MVAGETGSSDNKERDQSKQGSVSLNFKESYYSFPGNLDDTVSEEEFRQLDLALAPIQYVSREIGIAFPEDNFWALSFYSIVLPDLLRHVSQWILPQWSGTALYWNYSDSVASGLLGVAQLTDKTTHRPIAMKLKGVGNIASGVQLAGFTAINFGLFGSPAFAAGVAISLALSLDELSISIRRRLEFTYWLKDSLSQLKKIEFDLLPKTNQKIDNLKRLLLSYTEDEKNGVKYKLTRWLLKKMYAQATELNNRKQKIEKDIEMRLLRRRYLQLDFHAKAQTEGEQVPDDQNLVNNYLEKTGLSLTDPEGNPWKFIHHLRSIDTHPDNHALEKAFEISNKQCVARENLVKNEEIARVKKALFESILLTSAFVGMLLLCFPATHPLGCAIIAVTSVVYLAKNTDKIIRGLRRTYDFFHTPPLPTPKNLPELPELPTQSKKTDVPEVPKTATGSDVPPNPDSEPEPDTKTTSNPGNSTDSGATA